ncbi:hypothetical protein VTI74DRAFT_10179 [Chaetomium olivicolor]
MVCSAPTPRIWNPAPLRPTLLRSGLALVPTFDTIPTIVPILSQYFPHRFSTFLDLQDVTVSGFPAPKQHRSSSFRRYRTHAFVCVGAATHKQPSSPHLPLPTFTRPGTNARATPLQHHP